MNTASSLSNFASFAKNHTLALLELPLDTDFAQLGHEHGSKGLKAQYPQYIEYYDAWADAYRQFLLSSLYSSPF